ncbi:response regulator [Mesorhizobium sp. WSM3876]|uniref:response regulator n=1 Tax=Mesorhizobium sp. WSM3876 TaxID=422277 RepID=UPI000BB084D5|nr:response regulator [Mesorhizobium sp. WSM3876]PBB83324.1 hypothetical protein CK216_29590 [Mesorhizobium sp. WSM3876]TGT53259.1 response regulator [Mesorhizobium sp. M00.F.Ca.ET.170.01.1.1]
MNDKLPLSGLRVLVVEDAFLIAMDLCDQLKDAGCEVIGPAATVKQALEQINGASLDGAVLDINLAGERSFPIAQLLTSRGVPFLFLSGYDSAAVIPDEFAQAPRLTKPVDIATLGRTLALFRR